MTSTSVPLSPDVLTIGPERFPPGGETSMAPEGSPASKDIETLTLAERVEREATAYRARGTPEGAFLARQLERLAQLVRWTGASTPEEHEARMEVWDEEVREQWFDRGYQEGLEAGRREGMRVRRQEPW